MLAFLQRHPVPIQAYFDYSLVLTYAFESALLRPLLPPGLILDSYLDTYRGSPTEVGFLAIALVQTRGLRPVGVPRFLGRDFFLSGYRIFARYKNLAGRTLRGLRILRSDTDSRWMALAGNLLTHYNYSRCKVDSCRDDRQLTLAIHTPGGAADLALRADLAGPAELPAGSPFPDWQTARKFAGPLPFTFDYEAKSHSIGLIEGVRQHWTPRPVKVAVETATFFARPPFAGTRPLLASAFFIEGIPYRWRRGVVEPLPQEAS